VTAADLPEERLGIAVLAVAMAKRALDLTLPCAIDRRAFGRPVSKFQVNRHFPAEMKTKLDVAQTYLDQCVMAADTGEPTMQEVVGAEWRTTKIIKDLIGRNMGF
jgi:acyl-CoA dehydrogenase